MGRLPGASLDDDCSEPIGAEFWGLSRAARQHFAGSTIVSPTMKSIAAAASAGYATNRGNIPPRVISAVLRRWNALPPIGCVLQRIDQTSNRQVSIRDVRVTGSTLIMPTWDEHEEGVCLVDNRLDLFRSRLTAVAPLTANISAHGLARWYMRQATGTAANFGLLSSELRGLADAAPTLLGERRPGDPVMVETEGGAWHGHVATDGRGVWCNIRTFY